MAQPRGADQGIGDQGFHALPILHPGWNPRADAGLRRRIQGVCPKCREGPARPSDGLQSRAPHSVVPAVTCMRHAHALPELQRPQPLTRNLGRTAKGPNRAPLLQTLRQVGVMFLPWARLAASMMA